MELSYGQRWRGNRGAKAATFTLLDYHTRKNPPNPLGAGRGGLASREWNEFLEETRGNTEEGRRIDEDEDAGSAGARRFGNPNAACFPVLFFPV